MKGQSQEVRKEECHRLAGPVAFVGPAPSVHPYAAHTEKLVPPAPLNTHDMYMIHVHDTET